MPKEIIKKEMDELDVEVELALEADYLKEEEEKLKLLDTKLSIFQKELSSFSSSTKGLLSEALSTKSKERILEFIQVYVDRLGNEDVIFLHELDNIFHKNSKEENINNLLSLFEENYSPYMAAYVLLDNLIVNIPTDVKVYLEEILENTKIELSLTSIDKERKYIDESIKDVEKLLLNANLIQEAQEAIEIYVVKLEDNEKITSANGLTTPLYVELLKDLLYAPEVDYRYGLEELLKSLNIRYENSYVKYVRPKINVNAIRMDEELYILNEIIRVYHSNEFVSPNNADVFKTLVKRYVDELRKKEPKKIKIIEEAIYVASSSTTKKDE